MIESYDNCELLIPMTGANDGTVFTDYSKRARIVTPYTGAVTKTGIGNLYDGSAGYFNGTGYLKVGYDDEFNLYPKGTVSLWANITSLAVTKTFLYYGIYGSNEPWGVIYESSTNKLLSPQSYGTAFRSNVLTGLTTGWHHIELVGDGAEYWWFLDGVQVGYRNAGASFPNQTSDLWIGRGTGTQAGTGYIQDLAIWKGAALHKTNFTPPTKLMGTLSNSGSGVPAILNSSGNPFACDIKAVARDSASVFRTTSDASGRFSMTIPMVEVDAILKADQSLDAALPDLFIPNVTPV